MTFLVAIAFGAGMLVTLSRQVNGRLALGTSALVSSFWNHLVGLAALAAAALIGAVLANGGDVAGLLWGGTSGTPPAVAWLGGPLGVLFIAGGSWLIPRLGAVMTGVLLIAGQMLSGVALDLARGAAGSDLMRTGGVALILAGVWVSRRK